MKEHNVKAYNFVGARINEDPNSKYHAIQHFKKGFGGEMREGYLFKTIINKSKYKLFYKLRALKNRDFVGDVIDQEFHKWTNINE
jgi:FemAB family.